MRNSSTLITSSTVDMSCSAMLKLSFDGACNTKVPMPCRVSTKPEACSLELASRTTVRLTASSPMMADSVGNLSPGRSRPFWI